MVASVVFVLDCHYTLCSRCYGSRLTMTSEDHESRGMLIMAIALAGLSLIWGQYIAAAMATFMAVGTIADTQWRRWRNQVTKKGNE